MRLPSGYPCKACKTVMHDTSEGRGYSAGTYRFVLCNGCADKFDAATKVAVRGVGIGLQALLTARAPGLLPIMKQLADAYAHRDQQEG